MSEFEAAPRLTAAARVALCLAIGLGLGACETMSGAWKGTKNTVSGWFESDSAPAAGETDSAESKASAPGGAASSTPSSGAKDNSGMSTGTIPGMSGGSGSFRSTSPAPSLASVPSEAPKPPSTKKEREEATEGLVADRERAQYTDQGGRREPMVVRPLGAAIASTSAPAAPAAAQPAARAPEAAPAQPVAPRTTALAERLGAAPPPPPPPEGVAAPGVAQPAPTAAPQALRPTSPAPAVAPAAAPAPRGAGALIAAPRPVAEVYGDETILIDGSGARGGGVQQLATAASPRAPAPRAAFDPGGSSVSSQIGTISFAPGSTRLSPTARAVLADVAQLRADVDGAVRIEARGADANSRAAAISAELKRLGVPAARLYAGSGDGFGEEADIYLDY